MFDIEAQVFVDATGFGDVLANLNASVQGMETPDEDSHAYLSHCGQSHTLDFFIKAQPVGEQCDHVDRGCLTCNASFSLGHWTWEKVWTYRRAFAKSLSAQFSVGDVSLQNWASMDSTRFLFASPNERPWRGGLDLAVLRASEQRALAFFHWFKDNKGATVAPASLCIDLQQTGTETGLAKMPYLRDGRRSRAGLRGFRLTRRAMAAQTRFHDTIGIGDYPADAHVVAFPCDGHNAPPSYVANRTMAPFFIPFRALTVEDWPNVLVAGKALSQTWMANTATREHPQEWTTGSAAGVAAAMMVEKGMSTSDVYDNVQSLQKELEAMGQPLNFN